MSFGTSPESESLAELSGGPTQLVRWGNAGLAVITKAVYSGDKPGLFLIDGPAINANAAPDVSSGTPATVYSSMQSMSPQYASASSSTVTINIAGTGFTPSSTACWSCNYLQQRFLPTTYVSATQLTVTAPVSSFSPDVPAEISIFDPGTSLFSTNALTFTVLPSSTGTTQMTPVNLCGLAMAWDSTSQLLYVGAADYDGQYPNSIVALNPATGAVAKSATVSPDPAFVSVGAGGEFLYVGYNGSTNATQLSLPGLSTASTLALGNPAGQAAYPGDLKAAPADPHAWAVTLIQPDFQPEAMGGVVVYDDNVPRPGTTGVFGQPTGAAPVGTAYDTIAWSSVDSLLTGAAAYWDYDGGGALSELAVSSAGVAYQSTAPAGFNDVAGNMHSDFGTGLIYSENGNVADPQTGSLVGSYGASGLPAPDSTLNRMFMLGQTSAQAGTDSYTVQSFDEKAFKPVSSIVLSHLSGTPIEMVRWGSSGLAVLTSGGEAEILENGLGMLYLIQDTTFVSAGSAGSLPAAQERVQHYWKRSSKRELLEQAKHRSNVPR